MIDNLSDLEQDILNKLKFLNLNLDEYDLKELTDRIKDKFLRLMIEKYNIFKIVNHQLSDTRNYIRDTITYSSLKNDKTFNFQEIEREIKNIFEKYTIKDKIKEVMPFLDVEKHFNKENKKYFSFYDFEKTISQEEIKNTINSLKSLAFSRWGLEDKYDRIRAIKEILEFIKYAFNINVDLIEIATAKNIDIYKSDLKVLESLINESQKDFKIKLCSKWFYLSFNNVVNMNLLKEMAIKSLIDRIQKDK